MECCVPDVVRSDCGFGVIVSAALHIIYILAATMLCCLHAVRADAVIRARSLYTALPP